MPYHRFEVITTARSEEKGRRIIESAKPAQQSNISFAIVEDVAKEGAFDTVSSRNLSQENQIFLDCSSNTIHTTALNQRPYHRLCNPHSIAISPRRARPHQGVPGSRHKGDDRAAPVHQDLRPQCEARRDHVVQRRHHQPPKPRQGLRRDVLGALDVGGCAGPLAGVRSQQGKQPTYQTHSHLPTTTWFPVNTPHRPSPKKVPGPSWPPSTPPSRSSS